jgi:hypothetical protein
MEIKRRILFTAFDFSPLTRTWEYSAEDVDPCRRQDMHLAIFTELRIISHRLPVKNPCNFGTFDENIVGEKGRRE